MIAILPLLVGWFLDLIFGDPSKLPHPIVWFGKSIAFFEHHLNKGSHRKLKGALVAIGLIVSVFVITYLIRHYLNLLPSITGRGWGWVFDSIFVFFCLAGTTLIREVREVFLAVDRSLEEGRQQVARIVGRDTSELSAQEVRTAALDVGTGGKNGCLGNTRREPERRRHRSSVLVCHPWRSRHVNL